MTALASLPGVRQDQRARGPGDAGTGPAVVRGPVPATDRAKVARDRSGTIRSWPLLLLAFPAAAEVWSGWVGIAQKTGFGQVSPLPGIWPSLHLDTSITLPGGHPARQHHLIPPRLRTPTPGPGRTRKRFASPASWPPKAGRCRAVRCAAAG